MLRFISTTRILAVALAACLLCCTISLAGKPDNPGGGGGGRGGEATAPYTIVDLLGLTSVSSGGTFIESYARSLTEPDATGTVLVVGDSPTPNEPDGTGGNWPHPVLWEVNADGTFSFADLGLPPRAKEATASDINDWEMITINTLQPSEAGTPILPAWVSVPGLPLQQLPSGLYAEARAISNVGEIVGLDSSTTALWQLDADAMPGDPISLNNRLMPADIADSGVMVGHDGLWPEIGKDPDKSWDEVDGAPAIAWFDSSGNLQVKQLEQPSGLPSGFFWHGSATAISPNGTWVTGWIEPPTGPEAFIWSNATGMMLLGRFGGEASIGLSVNNAGRVVGWSDTGDRKHPLTAFLWQGGQMFDLNALAESGGKQHLVVATGINGAGNVVGYMVVSSHGEGEVHAFALTPNVP